MQTRQIIDPEICKEHRNKSKNGEIGNSFAAPASHHPGMQHGRINEPRNQRPGFFGIPAPITAPGWISPDRTGYDADG